MWREHFLDPVDSAEVPVPINDMMVATFASSFSTLLTGSWAGSLPCARLGADDGPHQRSGWPHHRRTDLGYQQHVSSAVAGIGERLSRNAFTSPHMLRD